MHLGVIFFDSDNYIFVASWNQFAYKRTAHRLDLPSCARGCSILVSEASGRLFRRKDGKYLLYIPKDLAEDSMFPLKPHSSIIVKIRFEVGEKKITVENWEEENRSQLSIKYLCA